MRTSAGGGFALALAAPASPGDYSIAAARTIGGFAPASFTVVEAAPRAPATDPPSDPVPLVPSPQLAPDVAAPAILRPARRGEVVRASRSGAVELFCGRFEAAGISATCGAVSMDRRLSLRTKTFVAQAAGRAVRLRFYLTARAMRRLREARALRMRATVVARAAAGSESTATFAFTLQPPRYRTRPQATRAPESPVASVIASGSGS